MRNRADFFRPAFMQQYLEIFRGLNLLAEFTVAALLAATCLAIFSRLLEERTARWQRAVIVFGILTSAAMALVGIAAVVAWLAWSRHEFGPWDPRYCFLV
jgi:hypothetical protein